MRCSWLAFRLCSTGSGLDHLRQLDALQRSWAGPKKVSVRPAEASTAICASRSVRRDFGRLGVNCGPCPSATPRPSTRRDRRDSQHSACANATFAIAAASMPWADSSTICARRHVITDPEARRMIRISRRPSSSSSPRRVTKHRAGACSRPSARRRTARRRPRPTPPRGA
jgi:hypothetical protein